MILKDEIFPIGQIIKTHGLKGDLSFSANTIILEDADIPYIILEPEGLLVPFYIENVRMKTDTTGLIKLERIDSEEQARHYVGLTIYLPDMFLDKMEDDEFDTEYFIGFEIMDEEKGFTGEILSIDQSTANPLFVVQTGKEEILIPIAEEYITSIDHEKKIIRLELPEGLMEL